MRVAFDIGGVLSKYPDLFRNLLKVLGESDQVEIFIITDMHDHAQVVETLSANEFLISPENVLCSDYEKYGEACKAVLLKEHGIDLFVDDFVGYTQWDSQLGPAPVRLLVMPDQFRPYWHETWVTKDKSDFGRRVAPPQLNENKLANAVLGTVILGQILFLGYLLLTP